MDAALSVDWSDYRPSHGRDWCVACGQMRTPARAFCGICTYHMDNSVLHTCRAILHKSHHFAQTKKDKSEETSSLAKRDREIALAHVADVFPVRYAQTVGRNGTVLRSAGAWFAHVTAFQYMLGEGMQNDLIPLAEVFKHPAFIDIRGLLYESLYDVAQDPDLADYEQRIQEEHPDFPAHVDTLNRVFFAARDEDQGMSHLFYAIVRDLEKRSKLRVYRGGGNCPKCGASIPSGAALCEKCAEASKMDDRLAISKGGGVQAKQPEPPPAPKTPERMHITSD